MVGEQRQDCVVGNKPSRMEKMERGGTKGEKKTIRSRKKLNKTRGKGRDPGQSLSSAEMMIPL